MKKELSKDLVGNSVSKQFTIRRMVFLSLFVALGVVVSPILRVEGLCPMAHFINIVCSVIMGPSWSLLNAILIGIIRMSFMGIPPLALTGQVFGALLSGVFYKTFKESFIFAWIGEIIGTGIIGSLVSYPVMKYLVGKGGVSLFFYTPSFILATLMGGSVAVIFLEALRRNKGLKRIKEFVSL